MDNLGLYGGVPTISRAPRVLIESFGRQRSQRIHHVHIVLLFITLCQSDHLLLTASPGQSYSAAAMRIFKQCHRLRLPFHTKSAVNSQYHSRNTRHCPGSLSTKIKRWRIRSLVTYESFHFLSSWNWFGAEIFMKIGLHATSSVVLASAVLSEPLLRNAGNSNMRRRLRKTS